MDDASGPRNRKERRAAGQKHKKDKEITVEEITLKQPDRSGPKAKTLYELAAERQAQLSQGEPFDDNYTKTSDGQSGDFDDEPLSPLSEAIVFGLCLAIVHLTFDILVHHQYRQAIYWSEVFTRTATVSPILIFFVYVSRNGPLPKFPLVRQILFLATAISCGCYLIWSGNVKGYYAVMKRAPPLVTLWVWSVIELDARWAAGSVVPVVGYSLWNGFNMF